jgi:hypothetical protein
VDGPESQFSDFECSPDRTAQREPSEKIRLDEQEHVMFDFPVFEDPPARGVSTPSEFEEKQKKKVVVFDPKVVQRQKIPAARYSFDGNSPLGIRRQSIVPSAISDQRI